MAVLESTANNTLELVKKIVAFLTDPNNFGYGNQWQLLRPATGIAADIVDEVILKGVGDGQDEIYVGMKVKPNAKSEGQIDIVLNGFAGFDPYLAWYEQPGAIPHPKLPTIPLVGDVRTTFWLSANTSRFILVVQMSTQYESAYVGFLKPVAVERQYPYPLAIGGSYIEDGKWDNTGPGHSCFLNPGSGVYGGLGGFGAVYTDDANENTTSLRLRRPDGVWCSALNKTLSDKAAMFEKLCVWPQNTEPTNVLTVLDNSLTVENVIMFPCLLYETFPPGIVGQFDGVYFIGNREDLAVKDVIIHNGQPYKVFNNVFRRDNDEYFVVQWF
ncbi:hypothetical protein [Sporomusa sp. KB1]|jgi:hypothetical protein|uniref:hypothetical protein n=1 Tax=Sporomusa sp. KB1 TaxID=943346 RepID=UPI00119F0867|nr:hypothetical protein [Sporomusa sp. KB1]TWH48557.1 hypothetical protein Salpa_4722 [Sporomusa sp. KB1]